MKRTDIFRLRKLLMLKQQAAALNYKKSLTDREALRQRATDLARRSYSRDPDVADAPSAGDLHAANRYRLSLRNRAQSLLEAAMSLDGPIEHLRAKTTVALGREVAMERLMRAAKKEIRQQAGEREEASREQIVLKDY